jgi:hypothetical protein
MAVGSSGRIDSSGGPGGGGTAYTYDGKTWSVPHPLMGLSDAAAHVSCPTSSFCAVVGEDGNGTGYAYTYSNGSWSSPQQFADVDYLNGLSCATSTFCVAAGNTQNEMTALVYTYLNGSWSPDANFPNDGPNVFETVGCATGPFCIAEGVGGAYAYSNGAWSTQQQVLGGLADGASISCSSRTFCLAVGEGQNGNGNDAYIYSG